MGRPKGSSNSNQKQEMLEDRIQLKQNKERTCTNSECRKKGTIANKQFYEGKSICIECCKKAVKDSRAKKPKVNVASDELKVIDEKINNKINEFEKDIKELKELKDNTQSVSLSLSEKEELETLRMSNAKLLTNVEALKSKVKVLEDKIEEDYVSKITFTTEIENLTTRANDQQSTNLQLQEEVKELREKLNKLLEKPKSTRSKKS